MKQRTKSKILSALLCSIIYCIPAVHAQRVLELSSKEGVMFLSVAILDSDGDVLKTRTVKGRGYEWFTLPEKAETFQLKGLGVPTEPIGLLQDANTFVPVITLPPTKFDYSKNPGIMTEVPTAKTRAPVGSSGYVFVGGLDGTGNGSGWNSIYLADDQGRRLDQDIAHPLTYKVFRFMAIDGKKTFTVDFPLNLREQAGATGTVSNILRAGQKVVISELLKQDSTNVFAKVTVMSP